MSKFNWNAAGMVACFLLISAGMITSCSEAPQLSKANTKVSKQLAAEYDFDRIQVFEKLEEKDKNVIVQFENFPISTWTTNKLYDFARDVAETTADQYPDLADTRYNIAVEFTKSATDNYEFRRVYSEYNFNFKQ